MNSEAKRWAVVGTFSTLVGLLAAGSLFVIDTRTETLVRHEKIGSIEKKIYALNGLFRMYRCKTEVSIGEDVLFKSHTGISCKTNEEYDKSVLEGGYFNPKYPDYKRIK